MPRNKMKEHKQQCRKRPYREGNLDADYETIDEVKKLKHECEFLAQGPSLTRNEPDKQLYVRLIKFFPKVAEAALKETAPASDSQPVSHSMSSCGLLKLPCLYKCGFTAKSMDNFEKHFVDCPKKTISCRYCKKFEERRNIVKHEKNCPERTESCPYCEREVKQRELTPSQHFQSCTNYPVDCKLCQQVVVRSLLGEHQQSDCSGRKVVCNRCLTTTSAGELVAHKKSCRLMQPIILKGSPQIKLVPQVNAKGPFYQEEDGNTSTVYLPITRTRIEEMAGKHSMFPTYMQCTLAGKSTSVAESVYKVQVVGGEGHVYHWYFNLLHTRFSSDTSCRVDLIDDNQNYFPLFNKWGGVREINVNNRNEVMAVFDTGSKTIHDFLLKRSTDMHLVRIEATDQ